MSIPQEIATNTLSPPHDAGIRPSHGKEFEGAKLRCRRIRRRVSYIKGRPPEGPLWVDVRPIPLYSTGWLAQFLLRASVSACARITARRDLSALLHSV